MLQVHHFVCSVCTLSNSATCQSKDFQLKRNLPITSTSGCAINHQLRCSNSSGQLLLFSTGFALLKNKIVTFLLEIRCFQLYTHTVTVNLLFLHCMNHAFSIRYLSVNHYAHFLDSYLFFTVYVQIFIFS